MAQAVSLNVTVVNPEGPGFIGIWPGGEAAPSPLVSSLNYVAGQVVPNAVVAPLGSTGAITVVTVSKTDLLLDVNGYYEAIVPVETINGLNGNVALQAGPGVTLSPSGQSLTISAPGAIGGTITGVGAGSGLTGGGTVGNVSVSVASQGITSSMIANGAVGSAQINTAQVQTRINSGCAPGATIQSINADGSIVCQAQAVPQIGFSITALDTAGDVGKWTSVAVGTDGLPIIAYRAETADGGYLKLAHCSNLACTAATISTIDAAANVGVYNSIAIGADGLPIIAYYDMTNSDLKVAHCSNALCTSTVRTAVDATGDVGSFASLSLGTDGLPIISYLDSSNALLKVAHCSDALCAASTKTSIPAPGAGYYTSITIGRGGLPYISHVASGTLTITRCTTITCSANTTYTCDATGTFQFTSIGTDRFHGPVVTYANGSGSLRSANVGEGGCSYTVWDGGPAVGDFNSQTLAHDVTLAAYYDEGNGNLKVAAGGNTPVTVDSTGDVGRYTSITMGSDGLPFVAYYDATNYDLKVVHCSNTDCIPYAQAR
jgi:predicted regulator of Ras-like GTPase activity (Roadblock/LC7/MglB family)